MKKFNFSILFFSLLPAVLYSQTSRDSLNFSIDSWNRKYLSVRLDKQLNTFNLYSTLDFGQQIGDLFTGFTENYSSTLIRTTPQNIKDVHFFSWITQYSLSDNIKFGMLANNDILSDDRKIALNQTSSSALSMFLKYSPLERIYAAPFGGYSINNQIGEKDNGYIYGFEGLIENIGFSDIEISSAMKYLNEDISPRKNTLRLFTLNATNNIASTFRNILSGYYVENRKDFYYTADTLIAQTFKTANNIQSRTETNFYLEDRFLLPDIYENMSVEINGRSAWRIIDNATRYRLLTDIRPSVFDAKIEEFKLDLETSAYYHSPFMDGSFRISYSDRDEKHIAKRFEESNVFLREERIKAFEERSSLEAQKNNKAERITVSLTGNLRLSSIDHLFISLLQNKLTYDTPSDDNFDDRDEVLSIFRMYYLRNVSPSFDAFVNLEGSINHIVYIFSERSSNNNISRFLKLGSGGNLHNGIVSSRNMFEVSANYTVYDFEDLNPNYKSFSFRQLSFQDSSSIRLNNRTFFSLRGYLKYSEQGDFNWARFSGKPTRYLNEYYLETKMNYSINSLTLGSGIRYLLLRTFSYNNNVQHLESSYRSLGPIADLTFSMNNRLIIRFLGWYEFIKTEQNIRREIANLNVQVNWGL